MSNEPDFLNHYEPTYEQLEALTKAIHEAEDTHAGDLFYSHDSNVLPALREIIRSAEKAERERIATQLPVPHKPARV